MLSKFINVEEDQGKNLVYFIVSWEFFVWFFGDI